MWKVITWITSIFDIVLDQLKWLASFQVSKFIDLSKNNVLLGTDITHKGDGHYTDFDPHFINYNILVYKYIVHK